MVEHAQHPNPITQRLNSTMCTCIISWVDSNGDPTYDNNEAIARAVCYDPRSFGEAGSIPFPICAEHASKKGQFWKLIPLVGQELKDAHTDVKWDAETFRIITDVVSASIKNSFPDKFNDIMPSVRWSYDHFSFNYGGMYVGVELDGYVHT